MVDRVLIPIPGGRWLALDRDSFEAALAAGSEISPPLAQPSAVSVPRLLTSEQLSAELNVPATWIEEAARRGELPAVRVGKYVRFALSEVLGSLNPRMVSLQESRDSLVRVGRRRRETPEMSRLRPRVT
jgi:excisionase family DNA binding protein